MVVGGLHFKFTIMYVHALYTLSKTILVIKKFFKIGMMCLWCDYRRGGGFSAVQYRALQIPFAWIEARTDTCNTYISSLCMRFMFLYIWYLTNECNKNLQMCVALHRHEPETHVSYGTWFCRFKQQVVNNLGDFRWSRLSSSESGWFNPHVLQSACLSLLVSH